MVTSAAPLRTGRRWGFGLPAGVMAGSAVQDAGFLLVELGLGQYARRQQLAELLQLAQPVNHVVALGWGRWWLRRRRGRVLRWRWRAGRGWCVCLVLGCPPVGYRCLLAMCRDLGSS
jgi:hypothetical protein